MKIFTAVTAVMILCSGMAGAVFAEGQTVDMSLTVLKPDPSAAPVAGPGMFTEYTKEAFDAASSLKRVLYFSGSWCPACVATEKALQDGVVNVPAGVMVFRVDYNTGKYLKERYDVVRVDTFVQVDEAGVRIARWQGGGAEGIENNLK